MLVLVKCLDPRALLPSVNYQQDFYFMFNFSPKIKPPKKRVGNFCQVLYTDFWQIVPNNPTYQNTPKNYA
jgi:hypothetical protein